MAPGAVRHVQRPGPQPDHQHEPLRPVPQARVTAEPRQFPPPLAQVASATLWVVRLTLMPFSDRGAWSSWLFVGLVGRGGPPISLRLWLGLWLCG
jgi:hypothetical protein